MTTRADYSYGVYQIETGRVIALKDLGDTMSITNDAEAVIADLLQCGILRSGDRVIYRDTMGVWDELAWDESSKRFLGFRHMGANSIAKALDRIAASVLGQANT